MLVMHSSQAHFKTPTVTTVTGAGLKQLCGFLTGYRKAIPFGISHV